MTQEEVNRIKKSISDAEKAIKEGLIVDYEVTSQLYRMIAYYKEKIRKFEEEKA